MLLRKMKQILAVGLLVSSILISTGVDTKAATQNLKDIYSNKIAVGLVSYGDKSNIKFDLGSDYTILNTKVVIPKGTSYYIELRNGTFYILDSKQIIILEAQGDITIRPANENGYIRMNKNGINRAYHGDMTFKANGSNFLMINTVDIDEYVKGVLPYEEGEGFPLEALKAQAVASRSYAFANMSTFAKNGYNLKDDTSSQVYNGYSSAFTKCNQAVDETRGEVLTYDQKPVNAVFSASNGGYMESAENTWGNKYAYLQAEADPFDTYEKWGTLFVPVSRTQIELDNIIKQRYPNLNVKQFLKIDIDNIKRFDSGRIQECPILYLDNNGAEQKLILNSESSRAFFGLKSSLFSVSLRKNIFSGKEDYYFSGSGFGHGVGMSQWGAYARAKAGQTYSAILNFYYKVANIEDVVPNPTTSPEPTSTFNILEKLF